MLAASPDRANVSSIFRRSDEIASSRVLRRRVPPGGVPDPERVRRALKYPELIRYLYLHNCAREHVRTRLSCLSLLANRDRNRPNCGSRRLQFPKRQMRERESPGSRSPHINDIVPTTISSSLISFLFRIELVECLVPEIFTSKLKQEKEREKEKERAYFTKYKVNFVKSVAFAATARGFARLLSSPRTNQGQENIIQGFMDESVQSHWPLSPLSCSGVARPRRRKTAC